MGLWWRFATVSSLILFDVPIVQTPSLDRLAVEGTQYTNAFATCPVCSPSRYGRITQLITDDFRWTGRFLSDHGQTDPRGKQFLCDGVIRMLLIIRFLGEIEANVIGSRD